MNEEEPEFEIEQEWSKIKEMYSSTCEEVLGKAKREQKAWISENTWRLVEERRVVKAKLEAAKTRQQKLATVERYNEKNHEVKRSCRRDKRQRIDEIARETEEAAEQRDMKRVYDTTRLLSGRKTVQSKPAMGDKSVETLCNKIEFLGILVTFPPFPPKTMLIFLFLRLHRPQRLHNIELGGRGHQRIDARSK